MLSYFGWDIESKLPSLSSVVFQNRILPWRLDSTLWSPYSGVLPPGLSPGVVLLIPIPQIYQPSCCVLHRFHCFKCSLYVSIQLLSLLGIEVPCYWPNQSILAKRYDSCIHQRRRRRIVMPSESTGCMHPPSSSHSISWLLMWKASVPTSGCTTWGEVCSKFNQFS